MQCPDTDDEDNWQQSEKWRTKLFPVREVKNGPAKNSPFHPYSLDLIRSYQTREKIWRKKRMPNSDSYGLTSPNGGIVECTPLSILYTDDVRRAAPPACRGIGISIGIDDQAMGR